jgi:hypothetical protein
MIGYIVVGVIGAVILSPIVSFGGLWLIHRQIMKGGPK